jgi:hypothetical protein
MEFPAPLTVRLRSGDTVTQSAFNLMLTDDGHNRRVVAQLLPVTKPFVLWEGAAYDAAGDYTQAQAEARLRELLGPDPAATLSVQPAGPTPDWLKNMKPK